MANVEFLDVEHGQRLSLVVGADEARTIYLALLEYKNNLLKTGAEATKLQGQVDVGSSPSQVSDGLEDEAFAYLEASRVAHLMYEIRYDHDSGTVRDITKFLDIG